jgi:hypothetical protein
MHAAACVMSRPCPARLAPWAAEERLPREPERLTRSGARGGKAGNYVRTEGTH